MKTENLEQVIEMQEKKLALLKEYKESLAYEKCTYHLVPDGNTWHKRFFLVLIATGNIVADGIDSRIRHYVNLRKIDTVTIYNWKIMPEIVKKVDEDK